MIFINKKVRTLGPVSDSWISEAGLLELLNAICCRKAASVCSSSWSGLHLIVVFQPTLMAAVVCEQKVSDSELWTRCTYCILSLIYLIAVPGTDVNRGLTCFVYTNYVYGYAVW